MFLKGCIVQSFTKIHEVKINVTQTLKQRVITEFLSLGVLGLFFQSPYRMALTGGSFTPYKFHHT